MKTFTITLCDVDLSAVTVTVRSIPAKDAEEAGIHARVMLDNGFNDWRVGEIVEESQALAVERASKLLLLYETALDGLEPNLRNRVGAMRLAMKEMGV